MNASKFFFLLHHDFWILFKAGFLPLRSNFALSSLKYLSFFSISTQFLLTDANFEYQWKPRAPFLSFKTLLTFLFLYLPPTISCFQNESVLQHHKNILEFIIIINFLLALISLPVTPGAPLADTRLPRLTEQSCYLLDVTYVASVIWAWHNATWNNS